MAIYAGDWLDGAGKPFDPQGVSRTAGGQGQVAQVHAPPDPRAPNRIAFGLAAKQSAHDYLQHLPDEEFDLLCDWDDFPGSTFRHQFDPLQILNPWERFNCRLFLDYYLSPTSKATWPVPSQQYTVTFDLTDADAGSYTATLHVTYDVEGEPDPDNGFVVYHIDPSHVAGTRDVFYTRLSTIWEWSEGHAHEFDHPCPFLWPMAIGEPFKVLIRVKQRWFWMQSQTASILVS